MTRKIGKRCGSRKFYKIRRGKKRCRNCGREFKLRIADFNLTRREWKKLIFRFVLGQPIREIEKQTTITHYPVAKAVKLLRVIMARDVPGIFSGTVGVDETYLGGREKNKRKDQLRQERQPFGHESRSGLSTTKQPVFGILTRSGKVFTELVAGGRRS